MIVLKPQGAEVSLSSNTTVANSTLVRVINTGAAAVLHFSNSDGEYANLTVSNVQYVVVQKAATDNLQGSNMLGVPVGWKY